MEKKTDVLLEGEFFLFPMKVTKYCVNLTRQGVTYKEISRRNVETMRENIINIGDVVGCRCKRAKSLTENYAAYFVIFTYQFKMKPKRKRIKREFAFGIDKFQAFEENLKICQKWRNVIVCLARNISVSCHEVELCTLPPCQRLLVLINPHSGPGKALQIFENSVRSMLEEANISYKVIITEYAGHATELIVTLKLEEWSGVVIVSGDGLIYEVINGLMRRKDWDKAIKFPIGCLPGGSGNALCCSVNYLAGEPLDSNMVLHSTFVLIKHRILPIDLVLLQTKSEQLYSFLSVAWGIIADIDYESEKLRSLGSTRFTLYALMRIVKLRKYRARISFLPISDLKLNNKTKKSQSMNLSRPRRYTIFSNSSNQEALNSVYDVGTAGQFRFTRDDDGQRIRSQSVPTNLSGYLSKSNPPSESLNRIAESSENLYNIENEIRLNGSASDENHEIKNGNVSDENSSLTSGSEEGENGLVDFNLYPTINEVFEENDIDETVSVIKDSAEPVPCPLLTPLDQPVPNTWTTFEGDFITAMAVYLPYLGPDNLASPDSRLNDGCMNLMMVKAGVSKNELLSMFLQFSTGEHINSPHCDVVKCLAFRLEPLSEKGNIMVDGERIEYGPIQGQILPGLARIMAIQ